MEDFFAFVLMLLLGASTFYLLIGFVIVPLIKIYKEQHRLKR